MTKILIEEATVNLALEALENGKRVRNAEGGTKYQPDLEDKAITALREALAEQPAQQEPVALEEKFSLLLWDYQELERAFEKVTGGKWIRKSNTPQRTWVGLTDEEISVRAANFYSPEMYKRAVLWAQEKLKERNQ